MISFLIPGNPITWKSHEGYGRKARNPHSLEKRSIQIQIRSQYMDKVLEDIPLKLTLHFNLEIPKSWSEKKKKLAREGKIFPIYCKKDCTNMQKFYEDCLKGIVVKDDTLFVEVHSKKRYSDTPSTIIIVEKLLLD